MKRSHTFLFAAALLAVSCGTLSEYAKSGRNFVDGVYVKEQKKVPVFSEQDFANLAAMKRKAEKTDTVRANGQGGTNVYIYDGFLTLGAAVALDLAARHIWWDPYYYDPWGFHWGAWGPYYPWRYGPWRPYDPWFGPWGPWRYDPWYGPYGPWGPCYRPVYIRTSPNIGSRTQALGGSAYGGRGASSGYTGSGYYNGNAGYGASSRAGGYSGSGTAARGVYSGGRSTVTGGGTYTGSNHSRSGYSTGSSYNSRSGSYSTGSSSRSSYNTGSSSRSSYNTGSSSRSNYNTGSYTGSSHSGGSYSGGGYSGGRSGGGYSGGSGGGRGR